MQDGNIVHVLIAFGVIAVIVAAAAYLGHRRQAGKRDSLAALAGRAGWTYAAAVPGGPAYRFTGMNAYSSWELEGNLNPQDPGSSVTMWTAAKPTFTVHTLIVTSRLPIFAATVADSFRHDPNPGEGAKFAEHETGSIEFNKNFIVFAYDQAALSMINANVRRLIDAFAVKGRPGLIGVSFTRHGLGIRTAFTQDPAEVAAVVVLGEALSAEVSP